jgi:hypothetical protein
MTVRMVAALAAFVVEALAGAQNQIQQPAQETVQAKTAVDPADPRQQLLKFLEEHPGARAELRKLADADGDGKLSPSERQRFLSLAEGAMKKAAERREERAEDRLETAEAITKNRREMEQLRQEFKQDLDQLRDQRRDELEQKLQQRQAEMQKRIEDGKQPGPGTSTPTGTADDDPSGTVTPQANQTTPTTNARPASPQGTTGAQGGDPKPAQGDDGAAKNSNADGKTDAKTDGTGKQGRDDSRPPGGSRDQRQDRGRPDARPVGGTRDQRGSGDGNTGTGSTGRSRNR